MHEDSVKRMTAYDIDKLSAVVLVSPGTCSGINSIS